MPKQTKMIPPSPAIQGSEGGTTSTSEHVFMMLMENESTSTGKMKQN